MPRPIEIAVECRQELVALSTTYEQASWKFKIESSFPRWRDRTERSLAASVSLKVSAEFARLQRKPRSNDSWIDVVAKNLAFLEELVHDVQIHPDEYGPSIIAHERRMSTAARDRSNPTPTRVPVAEPEKVTLLWLAKRNLSVPLIAIYVGLLVAAFALGVRLAHVPAVERIVPW
ncbi:MAG: hypothetical protein M3Y30_11345 [Gemmatimonadota bacterium]|nr:hypothetical protein [Gemmatimonadota bacterium]